MSGEAGGKYSCQRREKAHSSSAVAGRQAEVAEAMGFRIERGLVKLIFLRRRGPGCGIARLPCSYLSCGSVMIERSLTP